MIFMQVYAARDPKAMGISSIEPKLLCSFSAFIQYYAAHDPKRIGHSKHSAQTALQL